MAMGKFESEAADVQVQFGGELGSRPSRPLQFVLKRI